MNGKSRVLGMLALFGAILGQSQNQNHGIPMPAPSFGGFKRSRSENRRTLSPEAEKLRKSRKRQENKSRAINAAIRRAA